MRVLLGRISFALFGQCYLFSLLLPIIYTAVKRHSAQENVVVHSKIID